METITHYFYAERAESLLFVSVGAMAIAFAIYFLVGAKQPLYTGMAYPFIAVALIQIIVGSTVFFRSPKDIQRVESMIQTEKSRIQSEEIPRMEVVMKNFEIYKWIEICLLGVGLFLFFYFSDSSFWKGVGLGLAIQAGFMLFLDFFAESRGKVYLEYLKSIN